MPKYLDDLTAERLREMLFYDPDTGVFRWKVTRPGPSNPDRVAGRYNRAGYLQISVDGRRYLAHRLAWLYVHGSWPTDQLDHISLTPRDNRIANLREATQSENLQNRSVQRNNKSGHPGVHWHKHTGKWQVEIVGQGTAFYVGVFPEFEDAVAARIKVKSEVHAFHPTDRRVN